MDQLHVLFQRLSEVFGSLAGLVYMIGGAVLVWLLAMALYRYLSGSIKLAALYEEVLGAVAACLSLSLAAGVLNGGLFPANAWPMQLVGVLLALYTVKTLKK